MWFEWAALASGLFFVLFTMTRHDSTTVAHAAEQRTRSWLLDIIRRQPGIRLNALWREAHVARGTVQYHMEILCEIALVLAVDRNHVRRYFLPGSLPKDLDALLTLGRGRVLALADFIMKGHGPSSHECAEALCLSRKMMRLYATLLQNAGLVEERREHDRRLKRYYPTPKLRRARALTKEPDAEGDQSDGDASGSTGGRK